VVIAEGGYSVLVCSFEEDMSDARELPDSSLQHRDVRIHTDIAGKIITVLCVNVDCFPVLLSAWKWNQLQPVIYLIFLSSR
jgi:hypothetical protein